MPQQPAHWSERVHTLHNWSLTYPWEAHLADLNTKWNLKDKYRLSVPISGWPPAWFNGDIGSLMPEEWILVVSLNPALARERHYEATRYNADPWSFWINHNLNEANWNARSGFFPGMARLAAAALGTTLSVDDRPVFATKRMLFLEFCPYASYSFSSANWQSKVQPLADSDVGFAVNRQIRHLAMIHGKPRMVLLHGDAAIRDFKDHQCPSMKVRHLIDPVDPHRRFEVWEGVYQGFEHRAPIVGFKFLRHNKSMPAPDRRVELLETMLRDMARQPSLNSDSTC